MNWQTPSTKIKSLDQLKSTLLSSRTSNPDRFLNPTLDHIHDAKLMHDSVRAAKYILSAINKKKKIYIHGDFDVDGMTATSIMWDFLYRKLNANALPYIPSRFDEGYGLSDESIQNIIDEGGDVIITVDCGIKDLKLVAKYKDKIDFVLTDHHTLLQFNDADSELKDAGVEVNGYLVSKFSKGNVHPKINADYPFGEICGTAVSWKLCSVINELGQVGFNMNEYLDLVALATTCDIMPLIDENRAIVRLGLDRLKISSNQGLNALLEIAGVEKSKVSTYHFGYIIGPRLNAAGRIAHALDGVRLLTTESKSQAQKLALKLNNLNSERQDLTRKYVDLALEQVEAQSDSLIYFIYGDDWPEGILGLIAGRLSTKLNRPILVGSKVDNETIKGSARSIENFNIAEALKNSSNHLSKHGGHAGAAGFTLPYSNIDDFKNLLMQHADEKIGGVDLTPTLNLDAHIDHSLLSFETFNLLSSLEPFGEANPEPILMIDDVKTINPRKIGRDKNHIVFDIDSSFVNVEAIAFNSPTLLDDVDEKNLSIAGRLSINEWNGNKKLQVKVVDVK